MGTVVAYLLARERRESTASLVERASRSRHLLAPNSRPNGNQMPAGRPFSRYSTPLSPLDSGYVSATPNSSIHNFTQADPCEQPTVSHFALYPSFGADVSPEPANLPTFGTGMANTFAPMNQFPPDQASPFDTETQVVFNRFNQNAGVSSGPAASAAAIGESSQWAGTGNASAELSRTSQGSFQPMIYNSELSLGDRSAMLGHTTNWLQSLPDAPNGASPNLTATQQFPFRGYHAQGNNDHRPY